MLSVFVCACWFLKSRCITLDYDLGVFVFVFVCFCVLCLFVLWFGLCCVVVVIFLFFGGKGGMCLLVLGLFDCFWFVRCGSVLSAVVAYVVFFVC